MKGRLSRASAGKRQREATATPVLADSPFLPLWKRKNVGRGSRTATTGYAQEVEGLPCSDDLYQSNKDAKSFFKKALAAHKGDALSP
jgi:hypothetical protein